MKKAFGFTARLAGVSCSVLGLMIAGGESTIFPWSVVIGLVMFAGPVLIAIYVEHRKIPRPAPRRQYRGI